MLQPIGDLFLVFCEWWLLLLLLLLLLLDASWARRLGPIGSRGAAVARRIWGHGSGFGRGQRRRQRSRVVAREAGVEQRRPRGDLDGNARGEAGPLAGHEGVQVAVCRVELALRAGWVVGVVLRGRRQQAMAVAVAVAVGDVGVRHMQALGASRAGHGCSHGHFCRLIMTPARGWMARIEIGVSRAQLCWGSCCRLAGLQWAVALAETLRGAVAVFLSRARKRCFGTMARDFTVYTLKCQTILRSIRSGDH